MLVLIFNGPAEAGKGEVCKLIRKLFNVQVEEHSSIDWAKEIARTYYNWDGVTKDKKTRELLGDLKKLGINYNDIPTKVLFSKITRLRDFGFKETIACDIREPNEISKLKRLCFDNVINCLTIRIINHDKEEYARKYLSEVDNVYADYTYDIHIINNGNLKELEEEVHDKIADIAYLLKE